VVARLQHKRVACVTVCHRAPGCARTHTGLPTQRSALNRRGLKNLLNKTHENGLLSKLGFKKRINRVYPADPADAVDPVGSHRLLCHL
jgi:hypothetical protein